MRRFHFDRSPVVLALAAAGGLVAGGVFFAMQVIDSMFPGGYLMVLPFAAFVGGVVFLTGWACLSVSARDIRRRGETGMLAKVFGPFHVALIVKEVGVQQALVIARLVKSGRWERYQQILQGSRLTSGLRGKGVTDEDLADLAELRSVTWLSLAGAAVTDAGMARLTHLSVLQGLNLSGTKVTDACLLHLRELPGLTKLDVDGTKVTDAGLRSTGLLDKKVSLKESEKTEAVKSHSRAFDLFTQGKYAQAEAGAHEAVAAADAFGADSVWVGRALQLLAICQDAQRKFAEAEPTCQRALQIMEKAVGPEHPYVEHILLYLGRSQRLQGKFVSAESSLKRSLAIAEKHSRDGAAHHAALALFYLASGRLEAQAHFRSAVDKFDTALQREGDKPTHTAFNPTVYIRKDYAAFLREFAALLRERGQDDEAKKLESQAETIESRLR